MTMARPLIAVTGRPLAAERITSTNEDYVGLPADYNVELAAAGALGVMLSPRAVPDAEANAVMARVDGLMLTGGEDVDPALYGQDAVPETYGHDGDIDRFEEALYRAARRRGIPVLAICRGAQLLNVIHGGTLSQHIVGEPGRLLHGIPMGGGGSEIGAAVDPGSRLAKALGTIEAVGVCHHHQAVDRVADDLKVVARAADGTVEGLEPVDGDDWVAAVQWHPEDSSATDPVQRALFTAFADACRTDAGSGADVPAEHVSREEALAMEGAHAIDAIPRDELPPG